jgi:hypothetical protein
MIARSLSAFELGEHRWDVDGWDVREAAVLPPI